MPKNKKRRSRPGENENSKQAILKKYLFGGLLSAVLFFILLLIPALLTMNTDLSDTMQNILVFFFAMLSSFTGSFFTLKKQRENGLISGAITSLFCITAVCLVLLGILHTLGGKTAIMSLIMLAGGSLGGIVAVNK